MNKMIRLLVYALLFGIFLSCEKKEEMTSLTLTNKGNSTITEAIEIKDVEQKYLELLKNNYLLYDGENAVPFEIANGKTLMVQVEIAANAEKELLIKKLPEGETAPEFEKRTHAELWHREGGKFVDDKYVDGGPFVRKDYLRVPDGFMDHSDYIKYEGPGWESDKVAYRFYLDWRNAVDVFGKKTPEMVLNNVGQDGFGSYHEPADWGMDILKVGASLGIGSIGFWDGEKAIRVAETDSVICEITRDGLLRSQVKTDYYGWAVDNSRYTLSSYITIDAGSRKSHQKLVFDEAPANVCTGMRKDENATFFQSSTDDGWNYIATFGKQSLASDNVGVAIIYQNSALIKNTEDDKNHVVVLKPENNEVSYYFLAAWEQEPNGIKTQQQFKAYLDEQLEILNNPVEATFAGK